MFWLRLLLLLILRAAPAISRSLVHLTSDCVRIERLQKLISGNSNWGAITNIGTESHHWRIVIEKLKLLKSLFINAIFLQFLTKSSFGNCSFHSIFQVVKSPNKTLKRPKSFQKGPKEANNGASFYVWTSKPPLPLLFWRYESDEPFPYLNSTVKHFISTYIWYGMGNVRRDAMSRELGLHGKVRQTD